MRQGLSESELFTLANIWENDLSVGGAPEGWDYEYFERKVENKLYDGFSFKSALMKTLAEVPRPDDPKQIKKDNKADLVMALKKKLDDVKLAQAIEWAKKHPLPPLPPVCYDKR